MLWGILGVMLEKQLVFLSHGTGLFSASAAAESIMPLSCLAWCGQRPTQRIQEMQAALSVVWGLSLGIARVGQFSAHRLQRTQVLPAFGTMPPPPLFL